MKTITRRQLSREPATLKQIQPGQSVEVPDDNGGLVITRRKRNILSPQEMMTEVEKLTGHWMPMDTRTLMEDEE